MVDATVVATKVAAVRDAVDLAARGMIPRDLAERLAAATGFRNLVAHQYGVLDPRRVHEMAASELGDLLELCQAISRAVTR